MELIHNEIPREFLDLLPEGIKYIARQGNDFLVVEKVLCPNGHSLMADEVRIHGEPTISIGVKLGDEKGNFFVDAFWGSHKKLCDFFPRTAEGEIDAFCPVCGESLSMVDECCREQGCGTAKHVQLLLPGGKNRILVCGRMGCPGHRLVLKDASGQVIKKISGINFFGTQIDDFFGGI